MYIVLGASGHVGSAVCERLLERGERVTVVSHDAEKAPRWERIGARCEIVDVHDVDALREVFRGGSRAFVLNPPAAPSTDTSAEERRTVRSITSALDGSRLERVVAESTYGARAGDELGDLAVLHELEVALAEKPMLVHVVRGAYYMSNWDASLESARREGVVHTFYPIDFHLPMVAPRDVGRVAADLLCDAADGPRIRPVEGPERYSPADVAAAFAAALGKPVEAVTTPRDRWLDTLADMGFSPKAAASFAGMTAATLEGRFPERSSVTRGATTLRDYVSALTVREEE